MSKPNNKRVLIKRALGDQNGYIIQRMVNAVTLTYTNKDDPEKPHDVQIRVGESIGEEGIQDLIDRGIETTVIKD